MDKETKRKYDKLYWEKNKTRRHYQNKLWYIANRTLILAKKKKYEKKCYAQRRKDHHKKYPWVMVYHNLKRCGKTHAYRNVKNFLTLEDVKTLWFECKAWLLTRPSIDRIDTYGDYTKANSRFIELQVNQRRPKRKKI